MTASIITPAAASAAAPRFAGLGALAAPGPSAR